MNYDITQSRLLYVYTIDDKQHHGLLKVGEVFVDNAVADADRQELFKAVREILDARPYIAKHKGYHLELVVPTTYDDPQKGKSLYKIQDIHQCLLNSDVCHDYLVHTKTKKQDLWFHTDLNTIRQAIAAVKQGWNTLHGKDKTKAPKIVFRPEQREAIDATVEEFGKATDKKPHNRFLWNAKMRFGKTLCGLEVAKERQYKTTLIVTHRPVVDKGWAEDFDKLFDEQSNYYYASRMDTDEEDDKQKPNHIPNITLSEFDSLLDDVKHGRKKGLVLFVSLQYLSLSKMVGGKNDDPLKRAIMSYPWNYVMIDEAHEGTESTMGKRVIEKLKKDETDVLSLSGTPFNLLDQYDEGQIYTWDYVMEQTAKHNWDLQGYGDPNPYADLPQMRILTFTLDSEQKKNVSGKGAFSFSEFFRVWTGNTKEDGEPMPQGAKVGDFVHEQDVKDFIKLLYRKSDTSFYPFSTPEFRRNFRHTFWLLPGVKEAAALERLLNADNVFGKKFKIVNVAGNGNIEDEQGNALEAVNNAIKTEKATITLSCGKLTTGVSVGAWTAVLCMKGSENTSAASYMQTIFRVQTHYKIDGRQKSQCYVFDFAPDRALTAVAETTKMRVAANKKKQKPFKQTQKEEEEHLKAFLRLCPVVTMDGARMGENVSATEVFEKLKNVYIERAVRSGYGDNSIYDASVLLDLSPEQENILEGVYASSGSMASFKPDKININEQGLNKDDSADSVKYVFYLSSTNVTPARPVASRQSFDDGAPKPTDEEWAEKMTPVSPLWPYCYISHSVLKDGKWSAYSEPVLRREYHDPKQKDEAHKKELDERARRMSVLRVVAVRIPLLVYGAEINDDEEPITIDNFAGNKANGEPLVDDLSWEEFMPSGFTKQKFRQLKDCFDRTIFTGAAARIREMVKEADKKDIEDRIALIARIFGYLHNPNKETVLTPWRVVNLQLGKTVGGYNFFNDQYDDLYQLEDDNGGRFYSTRHIQLDATDQVFNDNCTRILEVNSKTGLYPLYMAYSVFKTCKEKKYREAELTGEREHKDGSEGYDRQVVDDQQIWEDVLQDNIFVVCRTRMAASITRRTLAGFRECKMNVKCYERNISVDDLVRGKVLKTDAEGVRLVQDGSGKHYTYRGRRTKMCEMIDVLRACPDLFLSDVVKGNDFWHVYSAIPKKENENLNNMKFTAVVGNPPYQIVNKGNGNGADPIYHLFIDLGMTLANLGTFIHPARFLFRAGKTPKDWNEKMLNDPHFKVAGYWANSADIFERVDIKGGVAITYWDKSKDFGKIGFFSAYEELQSILRKVKERKEESFSALVGPRELYRLTDVLYQEHPDMDGRQSAGHKYSLSPNILDIFPELFTDMRPEDGEDYIQIYGRFENQRGYKWVKKSYIVLPDNFESYKVFVTKVNGSGTLGEVLSSPTVGQANIGHTDTFLSVGKFVTEAEAEACLKYMKTKFARTMLGTLKVTQDNPKDTWANVPFQNFTSLSDIDWTRPIPEIDVQLFDKYGLDEEERAFINEKITAMD